MVKPTIFQRVETVRRRAEGSARKYDEQMARIVEKYQTEFLNPFCRKHRLNIQKSNGRYWFEDNLGQAIFDTHDASRSGWVCLYPVFPVLEMSDLRRGCLGNRLKSFNGIEPANRPRAERVRSKSANSLGKKEVDARVHAHGMGQEETRDLFVAWLVEQGATELVSKIKANGGWPPIPKKVRGA
jgi:hypothetical protein